MRRSDVLPVRVQDDVGDRSERLLRHETRPDGGSYLLPLVGAYARVPRVEQAGAHVVVTPGRRTPVTPELPRSETACIPVPCDARKRHTGQDRVVAGPDSGGLRRADRHAVRLEPERAATTHAPALLRNLCLCCPLPGAFPLHFPPGDRGQDARHKSPRVRGQVNVAAHGREADAGLLAPLDHVLKVSQAAHQTVNVPHGDDIDRALVDEA